LASPENNIGGGSWNKQIRFLFPVKTVYWIMYQVVGFLCL